MLSHHGGVLPSVPHRPLRKVDLGAQGKTRQDKARQGKARQDKTGQVHGSTMMRIDSAVRFRARACPRLPACPLPGTMGG